MTKNDLQKIRVAAADKEDVEFELDRAELVLKEAVTEAISHGEDLEAVAEVAELPLDDIVKLTAPVVDPDPIRPL